MCETDTGCKHRDVCLAEVSSYTVYVNPYQQPITKAGDAHRKQTSGGDLLVSLDITALTALRYLAGTWNIIYMHLNSSRLGKWKDHPRQLQAGGMHCLLGSSLHFSGLAFLRHKADFSYDGL